MGAVMQESFKATVTGILVGVSFGVHPGEDAVAESDDGFDYLIIKTQRQECGYKTCAVSVEVT